MFIVPDSYTLPPQEDERVRELIQAGHLRAVRATVLYITPAAKTLLTPPERPVESQIAEFNNFYFAIKQASSQNAD